MSLLFSLPAFATFAPKNNIKIPIPTENSLAPAGIDQQSFNDIIQKVLDTYQPIVAQHGGNLIIRRLWSNPTANSNTDQEEGNWIVNAFGGLARFPGMSSDGYAMVLCHEVGHHLGGYPKSGLSTWKNNLTSHWASNEGQSDYFSALKCFRSLIIDDPNNHFFATCSTGITGQCCHKSDNEAAVCTRTVNAGLILANVLHSLAGPNEPFKLNPDTPDRTRVKRTFDGHPNSQCRMDTYIAGAICDAPLSIPFSDMEPTQGACATESGHELLGTRPLCWYKSPQN